jgi:hypothetical protein
MLLAACTNKQSDNSLPGSSNNSLQSLPSNSFKKEYKTKYPNLNYSYNDLSQTHDYSNNWDFDGDGENDSLFFIGNGGAHLYFHLQLRLSSDSKKYDFPLLEIDIPYLYNYKGIELDEGKPDVLHQFMIADFDDDKLPEIYISLDRQSEIPDDWKKKGLTSHQVIVDYSNGKLELKNYR